MSWLVKPAEPRPLVSKYPNYAQARAYLVNFLRHGRKAFIRTKIYAYYQHSPSIRVLVIYVKRNILEVRAYPVDGFVFASIEEALRAEDFRAWLFVYDYRYRSISYITGSQKEGIKLYKRIKQGVKSEGNLARASYHYSSHPNPARTA